MVPTQPPSIPQLWKDNPRYQEIAIRHQQWQQHETTKELLKLLNNQKEWLVASVGEKASSSEASNEEVRSLASQIKNLTETIYAITDTERFVERLTRRERNAEQQRNPVAGILDTRRVLNIDRRPTKDTGSSQ